YRESPRQAQRPHIARSLKRQPLSSHRAKVWSVSSTPPPAKVTIDGGWRGGGLDGVGNSCGGVACSERCVDCGVCARTREAALAPGQRFLRAPRRSARLNRAQPRRKINPDP